MNIKINFECGSKWAEVVVSDGGSKIQADIMKSEFQEVAENMLDVAYDLFRAVGRHDLLPKLSALIEDANKPREIDNET